MKPSRLQLLLMLSLNLSLIAVCVLAQPPGGGFGPPGGGFGPPGGGFGPPGGGFGPPGGGFGPPGGTTRKILSQFDSNNDGWLNAEERKLAREAVKKEERRGPGGPGGFGRLGGFGRAAETKPGPKIRPDEVPQYPSAALYDTAVLRTLFMEFENPDWEKELEDFHGTDVDVPVTLTVDGKTYRNVGVHFRGMSSYMMVGAGQKRSFNLAMDLADAKQRLYGYKTLNLLNSHEDPTFLSTILYSHISRQYIPAPKANVVQVVINGESWGVYTSVQQFNKEFLDENFHTTKGARWKVRGSPNATAGLHYLGEDIEQYRRRYEIKSSDDEKSWKALIKLCKTLSTSPTDQLETVLPKLLDIDSLLWYLALDVALVNNDGYWTRASDYSLYQDPKGKFHVLPHDMNEAFPSGNRGPGGPPQGGIVGPPGGRGPGGGLPRPGDILPEFLQDALQLSAEQKKQVLELQKHSEAQIVKVLDEQQRKQWKDMREGNMMFGGPGGPGGPRGGGYTLDPLVALNDPQKPLRSKVLAVLAWKTRYLQNVKIIAEKSLDWNALGPVVAEYRKLLEKPIEADTRKLSNTDAFLRSTSNELPAGQPTGSGSLRAFAEARRQFLLNHPEIKGFNSSKGN